MDISSYVLRTGLVNTHTHVEVHIVMKLKYWSLREAVFDDLTITLFNPLVGDGMLENTMCRSIGNYARIRSMFSPSTLILGMMQLTPEQSKDWLK